MAVQYTYIVRQDSGLMKRDLHVEDEKTAREYAKMLCKASDNFNEDFSVHLFRVRTLPAPVGVQRYEYIQLQQYR